MSDRAYWWYTHGLAVVRGVLCGLLFSLYGWGAFAIGVGIIFLTAMLPAWVSVSSPETRKENAR